MKNHEREQHLKRMESAVRKAIAILDEVEDFERTKTPLIRLVDNRVCEGIEKLDIALDFLKNKGEQHEIRTRKQSLF